MGKGCLIALGVALVLGVVAVVGVVLLARTAKNEISERAGIDLSFPDECPFLDTKAASDAIGEPMTVSPLGPLDELVEVAFDGRFLDDGQACLVSSEGEGATVTGRVIRAEVGDAESRYAEIREAAGVPFTDDKGDGLKVVAGSDFDHDVEGVGDEAFCSTVSGTFFNGVFARKGDTLVYATFVAGADVEARTEENGASTFLSEANCERGAALAKEILDR